MATIVNGSEIVLTGTVGDLYYDDCFSAADVIMALASVGDATDITIRLNSGGGIATEGSAIHSAIARHSGKKTIIVEGIAASAASIIAMAADDLQMSLGAVMMIHDPSGFTFGTIKDHELQVKALTALAGSMATIYAAKSGREAAACRADMETELWMTAEEAVSLGYANRVAGAANDNSKATPTAFDYRLYAKAPQTLVAMATSPAAKAAVISKPKETTMTNTSNPAQNAADAAAGNVVAIESARNQGAVEGRAAALAYTREINELCALAGQPALAADFIAKDMKVDVVRTALLEARATAAAGQTITGHQPVTAQPASAQAMRSGWSDVVATINKRVG